MGHPDCRLAGTATAALCGAASADRRDFAKNADPNAAPLERDGLVQRTVYAEVPPRVEYALTPLGQTLCAPLAALRTWAETNITAVQAAQQRYDQ